MSATFFAIWFGLSCCGIIIGAAIIYVDKRQALREEKFREASIKDRDEKIRVAFNALKSLFLTREDNPENTADELPPCGEPINPESDYFGASAHCEAECKYSGMGKI